MIVELAPFDPEDLVYIGFFPLDETETEQLDRLLKVV